MTRPPQSQDIQIMIEGYENLLAHRQQLLATRLHLQQERQRLLEQRQYVLQQRLENAKALAQWLATQHDLSSLMKNRRG